jgi:UDP-hydrolysing UDP-N-acetyl-D-glucosamine 2-epimerase
MSTRERQHDGRLRVAVVTGTRAEFGLLRPVIESLRADERFVVRVVAAGAHLVPGIDTWTEVRDSVGIDARVPMQRSADGSRLAEAQAMGRGVLGLAEALATMDQVGPPDWVLVLGDRVEAFAAATAASLSGLALAHLHGGDRAEGVADEAMRHAITKLATLHLPATSESARRIARMGEQEDRIVVVGSPAMCGLQDTSPEHAGAEHGGCATPPALIVLHHPAGLDEGTERTLARSVAEGVALFAGRHGLPGDRVLWLAPNTDPGSASVRAGIGPVAERDGWQTRAHLPRRAFLGCLAAIARSSATPRGALVGNSSAGLIEAAALGVGVVNCGPRQRGRERAGNVVEVRDHAPDPTPEEVAAAIEAASARSGGRFEHPYGDGSTPSRVAEALARFGRLDREALRKRNTY